MLHGGAEEVTVGGVRHRLRLWRTFGEGAVLGVVMLNPSTAGATTDDPTLRRVVGFARELGYGTVEVVNLCSMRSVTPQAVFQAGAPTPSEGLEALRHVVASPEIHRVVVAWGAHGSRPELRQARDLVVATARDARRDLWCWGTVRSGEPRHPLYLRSDTPLERWRPGQSSMSSRQDDGT